MSEPRFDEDLWKRVHDTLDARGDPYRDPELAALLRADFESAAAVRRLLGRLELLREAEAPPSPGPRVGALRGGLALVAALALVALGGWTLQSGEASASRGLPARVDTSSIHIELASLKSSPPSAPGERVVLAPRHVLNWTLEGVEPCYPR